MDIDKQQFAAMLVARYAYAEGVKIPIEIHFVDNINTTWINYAYCDKVKTQFSTKNFSGFNGMVMPFDGAVYHILVKDCHQEYITTIIHECTHVCDYDRFRLAFYDGNIDIENSPYYWAMALYSEFNARAKAHKNYMQFGIPYEKDRVAAIEEENKAIIAEINQLEMARTVKGVENIDYKLMQYLGRLYANEFDMESAKVGEDVKAIYDCLLRLTYDWTIELFIELLLLLKQSQFK